MQPVTRWCSVAHRAWNRGRLTRNRGGVNHGPEGSTTGVDGDAEGVTDGGGDNVFNVAPRAERMVSGVLYAWANDFHLNRN